MIPNTVQMRGSSGTIKVPASQYQAFLRKGYELVEGEEEPEEVEQEPSDTNVSDQDVEEEIGDEIEDEDEL